MKEACGFWSERSVSSPFGAKLSCAVPSSVAPRKAELSNVVNCTSKEKNSVFTSDAGRKGSQHSYQRAVIPLYAR